MQSSDFLNNLVLAFPAITKTITYGETEFITPNFYTNKKIIFAILHCACQQYINFVNIVYTRPKPVEHGYVFGRYYWGMVETGPFFVTGRTVDWGGGLAVF